MRAAKMFSYSLSLWAIAPTLSPINPPLCKLTRYYCVYRRGATIAPFVTNFASLPDTGGSYRVEIELRVAPIRLILFLLPAEGTCICLARSLFNPYWLKHHACPLLLVRLYFTVELSCAVLRATTCIIISLQATNSQLIVAIVHYLVFRDSVLSCQLLRQLLAGVFQF